MTVIETPAPVVTPATGRRLMGKAYSLDQAVDADSARLLAGLSWEAEHRPLFLRGEDETFDMVEKERAVVRSDTGDMFGVVGREHKIVSNADFFGIADVLMQEAGTTWAEARPFGGARANGASPFLVFRLPQGIQVAGQDAVDASVLLNNGHVGNTALTYNVLPIRYDCSNVVTAALKAGKAGLNLFSMSIQHSGDMAAKIAAARAGLSLTTAYMREFQDLADRMAAVEMDHAAFGDFLNDLLPLKDDAGDRAKATVETQRDTFRSNWRNTETISDDLKRTTWGALNVITEVIDHGVLDVRKSAVPADERRFNSVNFGQGARLRARAYNLLAGV